MSQPPLPISLIRTMARSTDSLASVDPRIGKRKFVSVIAFRLAMVHGSKAFSAQRIFTTCDRFQMTRLDTCPVPKQKVDCEILWNRPYAKLVNNSRSPRALIFGIHDVLRISAYVKVARPQPASIHLLDQMVERKIAVFRFRSHSFLPCGPASIGVRPEIRGGSCGSAGGSGVGEDSCLLDFIIGINRRIMF